MNDAITTCAHLKQSVADMVNEREWNKFHTLKNLAMNVSVEAAELMELFLWCESDKSLSAFEENHQAVEHELADVLIAVVAFANAANIDLAQVFERKIEEVKAKYPVALVRGKSDKYTAY